MCTRAMQFYAFYENPCKFMFCTHTLCMPFTMRALLAHTTLAYSVDALIITKKQRKRRTNRISKGWLKN